MTPNVEQQLLTAVAEMQGDLREVKSALFGSEIAQGAIPDIRSTLEGQQAAINEHHLRISALEQDKKVEQVKTGLVLSAKQKLIAVVVGAPAFLHYSFLLLKDLKLIS